MNFRSLKSLAPLAAVLLLVSCAAKTQSPPPDPQSLEATFVDGFEGHAKKPPLPDSASSHSRIHPKKNTAAAAAVPWAGQIRMVNVAENFVLVESDSAAIAETGEKYSAMRDGVETAVLRMTPMRNPPFLIADIASGNPSPGDKIYLPRATAPTIATTPADPPITPRVRKTSRDVQGSKRSGGFVKSFPKHTGNHKIR